jgi:hypothetical protein
MTVTQITQILKTKPSYLKKGDSWLAENFGCSQKTARTIKRSLTNVKKRYIKSLAD